MTQSMPSKYSPMQRLLHWTIALLIFFNLLFPDGMNAWHHVVRQGGKPSAADVLMADRSPPSILPPPFKSTAVAPVWRIQLVLALRRQNMDRSM
jgi:hypothetical protein